MVASITRTPTNRYFAVINAGSSSFKFSLFAEMADERLERHAYGEIEGVGSVKPYFSARDSDKRPLGEHRWDEYMSLEDLLAFMIEWIERHLHPHRLNAVGHRMVHGGDMYTEPLLVTPTVMEDLRKLIPLAPLHQPRVLTCIDALAHRYPGLCQVVCFDTSFHKTNPYVSQLYGLPLEWADKGLRRFGFHGLSYEYIAQEMQWLDERASAGRTIVAHLGNGASMCALVGGKSVASTMGFSALDGLIMGTRCGQLDPGVLLYLMQYEGMGLVELEDLLYQKSGLLGVSGVSSDVRDLLASDDPRAKIALDLFVYRVVRETGSLAAACGGLDAFVFTAGIGEHSPEIRARVCEQLGWLGIRMDEQANKVGRIRISSSDSRIPVWVLPTFEELMIARHGAKISKAC